MTPDSHHSSMLEDDLAARWGFLEEESEACAVVSERMELVYLNQAGRAIGGAEWFGKRCYEVLPVTDAWCALHCQTIKTVNETNEIAYCQESVWGSGGEVIALGGAIIPVLHSDDHRARALIVLRRRGGAEDETRFREDLLARARALRDRLDAQLG